ncbi:hypothetical protein BJL95_15125 [Methylomonas sp. LWB]|nr:hypothetical protein BJL95_15125 [Methylomonas sp. LWB]
MNLLPELPLDFPIAAIDRWSLEVYFGVGNVKPYPGRDPNDLLVVTDKNGQTQVWVRPLSDDGTFNTKYRKDYETVMNMVVSKDLDIDHIQSKTRAGQQGYKYVRLIPLKLEVNRAWGARWEKRTANLGKNGFVDPSPPTIRMIDHFQWWKILGVLPENTPYG